MSRTPILLAAGAALVLSSAAASSQEARVIRVEPRAFYGATITLEAGVRVFRPLPRTSHIVINPDNKTPLSVSVTDVTERIINPPAESQGATNGAAAQPRGNDGYDSYFQNGYGRGYCGGDGRIGRHGVRGPAGLPARP